MATALKPYEVTLDNQAPSSYGEFGRKVKPKRKASKHEPKEAEILYRELIEDVQYMEFASMSMSMSMALSTETQHPTEAPTSPATVPAAEATPAPTIDSTVASASCDGQPQVLINLPLEVDTLDVSTPIAPLIAQALTETLSDEYTFCGERRRRHLEDGIPAVEEFQLGDIAVTKDTDETCFPLDPAASSCQVANLAITVSGEVDGAAAKLRKSLASLFENDSKFIEELPQSGIIEVRLKESSEEAEANSIPTEFGSAEQPTRSAVVAILSTAGLTVIAAILFRTLKKERNSADKFSESDSEGDTLPIHNGSGSP